MNRQTSLLRNAKEAYERQQLLDYGPVPENPFRKLRLQRSLTLEDLAGKIHCSVQALIRLEQGCFTNPLPLAIEYWVDRVEATTHLQLVDAYEGFQEETRRRHHRYFQDHLANVIYFSPEVEHPFKQLKSNHELQPSTTEVAKALCMSQATLAHWEKKWRTQQSVPKEFQTILMSIGYSKYEVQDFNEAYYQWRQMKLGRVFKDTDVTMSDVSSV